MTCNETDGARKFRRWRHYRPTWPHLEGLSRLKSTYSTRLAGLIRSHKNLTKVVWTNEVHRLLTIVLLVKQRTVGLTRLADVRVSAGQRTTASAARNDRTVGAQNPRLHLSGSVAPNSPDLNPVAYKLWGSCNSGSIRPDDVQECGWTQEATGWKLDWSGAEHYWHCYQRTEKLSACFCSREGPTFQTFTVGSWTTGQLDKLSARVTKM